MNIPGEDALGVYKACDFLNALAKKEKVHTGGEVVVIGGGNSAIDAAAPLYALTRRSESSIEDRKPICQPT